MSDVLDGTDDKIINVNKERKLRATIVDKIEESIKLRLKLVELPIKDYFAGGIYVRSIYIPAGTVLTSRRHKYEHPFNISKGLIQVIHEDGEKFLYKAPYIGTTQPGTRRALLAIEDTIWTTYHVTNLTTPDEVVRFVSEAPENPLFEELFI